MNGIRNKWLALSLANKIEKVGRAITAKELAGLVSVSKVTIQARRRRKDSVRLSTRHLVSDFIREPQRTGCEVSSRF